MQRKCHGNTGYYKTGAKVALETRALALGLSTVPHWRLENGIERLAHWQQIVHG